MNPTKAYELLKRGRIKATFTRVEARGVGGGGTAIYGLYRHVPL